MDFAQRSTYSRLALNQIPRLLSNQDRDPYSPTYGCFHRDFWLDKTSDFPDAVRQFAAHALALVYKHDFPGNIYKGEPKVRDWTIAALDFWASIQHRDGSFDEFYPYERGWVGPTGFTTFAAIEAFSLVQDEMTAEVAERVLAAIRRAAWFIAKGESEEDHLANHHAMAYLAVWKACQLLDDTGLEAGFERLWRGFLGYHNADEGWSREYDGVDPGYLSAVVSFLAKVYQTNPDPQIRELLSKSVEFCSYYVYPNGYYAGSLGSRNTLHFYPHGFEILAGEIPMAAAVAEKMLQSYAEGKLVPPEIMSDRYLVYRVPELLQAYLDYTPRPVPLPLLPHERKPFQKYFQSACLYAAVQDNCYLVANLAKGGVVKVFDRSRGQTLLNDCGLIGRLEDGRLVTTQWVDASYVCEVDENGWTVSGWMHTVPTNRVFTPLKAILFRAVLIALGWHPTLAHFLKGRIRGLLILGTRRGPARFVRRLRLDDHQLRLTDEVILEKKARFASLSIGDEFSVRYVPQSRYFQSYELASGRRNVSLDGLEILNHGRRLVLEHEVEL